MLNSLFSPVSVAVIGASSRELHIGNRIVRNLLDFGFKGKIYPVNPKSKKICDVVAYKSIMDIVGPIDVAHIVIPAKFVPEALDDCGKKGVKNVIINSGGFAEIGAEGELIQADFMERARRYGIRVLGPNCQGIINSDENVKAYCNFTFTFPEPGNISIVALSGGVAEAIHQGFVSSGIGTRIYASSGNACDISISEILGYLADDEKTHVVVTYVEGLNKPDEFMLAARNLVGKKPLLAMRAGRTVEGAKAAASHTGGLAGKDLTTELVFKKVGVIDFKDEGSMIDAAVVLASQPLPKGNKVGIVTNTGGPAVIATDVLVELGFMIPGLSEESIKFLRSKLYKESSVTNPIDVLATGTAEHFKYCLEAMMMDDNIDSVFVCFVTPFFVDSDSIALQIAEVAATKVKPIVCNLITDLKKWGNTERILRNSGVPCFDSTSRAANALGALKRYKIISNMKHGAVVSDNNVDFKNAFGIIEKAKFNRQKYLLAEQVYSILDAYGIKSPEWGIASNVDEAVNIASNLGYPVVLKADSTSIIHKSDVGGVALGLRNEAEVRSAVSEMSKMDVENLNFFVQENVPGDLELIFGAKAIPGLGHAIMFGLGGVFVEVVKDVVFCLAPVTDVEALNMVKGIKGADVIFGTRGRKAIDAGLLSKLIQQLSQLVSDFEEILELDLNPVVISQGLVTVLDARIFLKI